MHFNSNFWHTLILMIGILGCSLIHTQTYASADTHPEPILLEKDAAIAPISIAPVLIESPWLFEFGARYWYSTATYKENLLSVGSTFLISRLTYEHLNTNAAEAFWKLLHQNGVYLKGYLGGGTIYNGRLIDEDFPPIVSPYSRTHSPQKNGVLNYLSIDAGYDLFNAATWRLGAFIGYHYWKEQVNNFGCTQIAGSNICVPAIPGSVDILNNLDYWNSIRLGANGQFSLHDAWSLETDLAYIYSNLNEYDFHNLRPPIRGVLDTETGDGLQLDIILKWMMTEQLTFGAGGRWWHLASDGFAHLEQSVDSGQPQGIRGKIDRYGLLLEANYQFLDKPIFKDKDILPDDCNWQGAYLGGNLGYGTHPSMVYFFPNSLNAQFLQASNFAQLSLNVENAGFLAGGQLGYNWEIEEIASINSIILGIEADLDYASIGGANAATSNAPITTTIHQNIRWLSSLRARLGKLASPQMLVYLTAGPAWGGASLSVDQRNTSISCALGSVCLSSTKNQTQNGLTAGVGIEYMLCSDLTFKAEYQYIDLGRLRMNATAFSPEDDLSSYRVHTRFNENLLRLGMNYKMQGL